MPWGCGKENLTVLASESLPLGIDSAADVIFGVDMSGAFRTKANILGLLSGKSMTMTQISHELGLASSTVCQHIAELLQLGALERLDSGYARKWKYYRAVPGWNYSNPMRYPEQNQLVQAHEKQRIVAQVHS